MVVLTILSACLVASRLTLLRDWSKRKPNASIKMGMAISRMPRLSFQESDWRICLTILRISDYSLSTILDLLRISDELVEQGGDHTNPIVDLIYQTVGFFLREFIG